MLFCFLEGKEDLFEKMSVHDCMIHDKVLNSSISQLWVTSLCCHCKHQLCATHRTAAARATRIGALQDSIKMGKDLARILNGFCADLGQPMASQDFTQNLPRLPRFCTDLEKILQGSGQNSAGFQAGRQLPASGFAWFILPFH